MNTVTKELIHSWEAARIAQIRKAKNGGATQKELVIRFGSAMVDKALKTKSKLMYT